MYDNFVKNPFNYHGSKHRLLNQSINNKLLNNILTWHIRIFMI